MFVHLEIKVCNLYRKIEVEEIAEELRKIDSDNLKKKFYFYNYSILCRYLYIQLVFVFLSSLALSLLGCFFSFSFFYYFVSCVPYIFV
jgi:hypothetical protein